MIIRLKFLLKCVTVKDTRANDNLLECHRVAIEKRRTTYHGCYTDRAK